jgi:hypothetical protein
MRRILRSSFLALAASSLGLLACSSGPGDAASSTAGADSVATSAADAPANFAKVRQGLFRGGHPSYDNLVYLKSLGVTTIVDLEIADYIEATPEQIKEELNDAALLGLTVIREPMTAYEATVNEPQMNATLAILATTAPSLWGDAGGDDDDDSDGGAALDAAVDAAVDAGGGADADAGVDASTDAGDGSVTPIADAGADASVDAGEDGGDGGGVDVDAGPTPGAIYVHCLHGEDRTGLVIGLERVFVEGWSPESAWKEMLAFGFHTFYLGLDSYFFTQTGYFPPL